jgi:uncharacterized protein (DUF885 family)
MKNNVFIRGVLTTAIVAIVLFWGVGFIANMDPIWFIRTFHPGVSRIILYWDGSEYIFESGENGFEPIAAAFVDGVAHFRGYESLVTFSATNWADYRQRGRLLEVYYKTPVQVHSRYSFPEAKTYLVPLNRTHAYYRRVFGLPDYAEWAVGALSLDEERFSAIVTASENAVLLASGEITDSQLTVSADTPEQLAEPEGPDPTPASLAVPTPVPLPADAKLLGLENLPFNEFLEQSYLQMVLRNPEYITELGLGDKLGIGNDKLTDVSDAYIRETQLLEKNIYEILMTYDQQNLSPAESRSYDVYKWFLEDIIEGHSFMYDDYPLSQFIFSVNNSLVHFFTEIHPITDYQDAEDYLTRLLQIDTKFAAVLEGLKIREARGVILPRFLIQWTLSDLRSMAEADAVNTPYYQVFVDKVNKLDTLNDQDKKALYDSAETVVTESVLSAYQRLVDYYNDLQSVATDDAGVWKFSDGEAYYAYMLKHFSTTDLTAEEIHQLGLQEVERIDREIRDIAVTLGYPEKETMTQLFDRVTRESGVLVGRDILEGYEAIIQDANLRVKDSFDLLPSTDVVVIEDAVGGFYVSPALDGSRPGTFYASASGTIPKYGMPTLAYHEAVPGHHFQIALAQELDLPSFRKDTQFTAYAEGWALYAEYLAWELGFYENDPYGNLGRLQAEMFRAVRLVVDTGIHAKGWTFNQAVEYMQQHTGQPQSRVQYEIARYIVWPGQSVSYKIGMLKIMALRQKAQDALGDNFDIRTFHNAILGEGAVPLSILEQIVDEYIADELSKS